MTAEEIEAAGGKKTINKLMEEAEVTPGVWGRLVATGDHVWQENGGNEPERAVANCDTEEIAVFLVCAPKAITHLQKLVADATKRAETAEADRDATEQLRQAAIERENKAIAERDIARRQTAALERLSPPMRAIYWIVEHLKQTTPEVAAVREWLQRLETERE